MDYCNYVVDRIFDNKKVSNFFEFYHLSKTKIKEISEIYINNKEANLNTIIKTGDIISISVVEEIDFKILDKPIDIIYEDDYLLVINKPVGLIVHPDDKEKNGTLVNMVANYFKKNNIKRNVRYIHRIDTDTTGLIMFAKDMITSSYFNYLFSIHDVKRTYMAIVCGRLEEKSGRIDANIGEDRHHNQRRRVSKTGQNAVTNYEVLKEFKNYSLVKLNLETGRTHQIRVHMKYIGHPLAGDILYEGSVKHMKRAALHSYSLEFKSPYDFREIKLECKIPKDMMDVIDK